MPDDYINKIISFLSSKGITEYHFERLAKRRAVIIPYNGRLHRVAFPLGGPDWRGPANTIAHLRHALGLVETKASRRRCNLRRPRRPDPDRGRPFACRSCSEPALPAPDRFFAPLMLLKARMEAAAEVSLTSQSSEVARVALTTPWLGRQQRWATV